MRSFLRLWIPLVFFGLFDLSLKAQEIILVSGRVTNGETSEPLQGVNILIEGTVLGTSTDSNGQFTLSHSSETPPVLKFSRVGYQLLELETGENISGLQVEMVESPLIGHAVVVSASRMDERILESPVSVEKMGPIDLQESPAYNPYYALAEIQGVQVIRNSFGFSTIHARGIASNGANHRVVQRIDGVDNQLPRTQFPMGNLLGINDLDLESIEFIPGTSSTLYGPNAFNGTILMHSKDPFEFQGLSGQLKTGVTVQDAAGTNTLFEFSARYAKVFNDKLAIKLSGSFSEFEEWYGTDIQDLDRTPINEASRGPLNPSYDGANIYGDEGVDSVDLDMRYNAPAGTYGKIAVSRTGIKEVDLLDYDGKSIKFNGAVAYKFGRNLEASYNYRYGLSSTIFQSATRHSIKDIKLQQHVLEIKGDQYFIRGFRTDSDFGKSYDGILLANELNSGWKPNRQWFNEYYDEYVRAVNDLETPEQAHLSAREFADIGMWLPGSAEFDSAKQALVSTPTTQGGVKHVDKSSIINVEANYNFKNELRWLDFQVGGNFRQFTLDSRGEVFAPEEEPLIINEYGIYAIGAKKFIDDKLKTTVSIRWDFHDNFETHTSPRIAAVYSFGSQRQHNIRASYQTGLLNPTNQDQFADISSSPLISLIGASEDFLTDYRFTALNGNDISGLDVISNSWTANSVLKYLSTFNPNDLDTISSDFIQPEKVTAWELGYKGFLNPHFFLDLNGYYNIYLDFLLPTTVMTPASGCVCDGSALEDFSLANAGIFTYLRNNPNRIYSYGINLNINYTLNKGYYLGGNYSWEDFDRGNTPEALVPSFRKPPHRFNVYVGNRTLTEKLGFRINYRWYDSFLWPVSFLAQDYTDSYGVVDLQVSYRIPSIKSILRVGGNNIFKNEYSAIIRASAIGATYYVSLTFDELLN